MNEEADTAQVNYAQKVKRSNDYLRAQKGEAVAQSLETLQESAPAQQNQEEKSTLIRQQKQSYKRFQESVRKKAQEIIRFRDEQGPFKNRRGTEKNVPGIGEKTVERLKDMLTVTG